MSESYTASFHNGGMEKDGIDSSGRKRRKLYQACREHNIRDPKYCDKQEHIVKNGHHETWIDIPPKEAYEQIFGEAFREYNGKQKKKARQFNSYWEKVKKSEVLVPVREALVTIGNVEEGFPDIEIGKQIYKAFLEDFQKHNPNLKVIGAYYHADEMRNDGKGGLIQGAPHMHLDYIPVSYKCDRGQKIQNSMNGALIEQGILNIEIDPEVAEKKFGLREKPKRKKKAGTEIEAEPDISPEGLAHRLRCLPKPEEETQKEEPEEENGKKTKTRIVTNLVQWTNAQRSLLVKIAREHGLTIENPNEKREHLSTEDYILSKDKSLQSETYALAEKLLIDVKEVDADKVDIIEREKDVEKQKAEAEQKAKENEVQAQKNRDYVAYKEGYFRRREQEYNEREENLKKKESFFENAKKHASVSLHKLIKKLKNWKKEVEEKDRALDKALLEASKLAQRAQNLNDTTAPNYRDFANDIQFDEARKMAAKRDGKGLCRWFENLEIKFGSWLHRAQYFAKRFWNKTPDELVVIAEDMRQSYCSNLGEYIEKSMRANTLSQIREAREIQEEIPKVKEQAKPTIKKPVSHTRREIDWWD